jgi:citrate synthase
MLESIGTKDNIRRFLIEVKQKRRVLFGFGNRVYKSYDPRAKIVKRVAESVFALCGKEPLIELALEL